MSGRIALALVLHNHQPVGNFGWVIEETYERAYLPMLEAIERHPGVRIGLHYTGPLQAWLDDRRPDFVERLRGLAASGQVEVLGGGWFEPVLASLPERDRLAQLGRMSDEVERRYGRRPTTAWLAERVWEPDLPTSLAGAGYRGTIVDDAHFRAAGIAEDAMWGPYTTDDQGRVLTVFGTEQGLRYRIPFRPVEDVIDYLRRHATEDGGRLGTMGDDGEKFGGWPSTWEHCWGAERWVDRFFEGLEANAAWLTTTTPSAWLADHAPLGRTYIPVGSYAEMGEWALPPDESRAFHESLGRARTEGRPEARWLRGASWRNFQVKYREVNDLHKRMLRVSDAVEAMPPGPDRRAAAEDLLHGQSNDAYWHGLFGGIYLPHLRAATLAHLIAAEDVADRALGRSSASTVADLDLDGRDEVRLASGAQVVTVKPHEGGGIGDWDVRAARHALTAVLRRRPEAYHARLSEADGGATAQVASIHDVVKAKEPGLAARLRYDAHERRSGLLRVLSAEAGPAEYGAGELADLSDAPTMPLRVEDLGEGRLTMAGVARLVDASGAGELAVRTTIVLGGTRLAPTLGLTTAVRNDTGRALRARLGQEWSLTMLGGGGNPDAWYELGGARSRHDGSGSVAGVTSIAQGNDWLGLRIDTAISAPADAWWAPIETISNSEGGFERVYQGSSLLVSWLVDLGPGETVNLDLLHRVEVAGERTVS